MEYKYSGMPIFIPSRDRLASLLYTHIETVHKQGKFLTNKNGNLDQNVVGVFMEELQVYVDLLLENDEEITWEEN